MIEFKKQIWLNQNMSLVILIPFNWLSTFSKEKKRPQTCEKWDKLWYRDVYPTFMLHVLEQKLQCYESNYNIEKKFTKFIYTIYMKLNKITTMRKICSKSCKMIVHFVITIIRTRL